MRRTHARNVGELPTVTIEDRTLVQWLADPPAGRGLHFAGPGERWEHWSYPALAELTLRTAGALAARGLRPGAVVVLVQRSSPGFAATLFGAIAAGLTACSIAPPFVFQRSGEYEDRLVHLLQTAQPDLVVCDDSSLDQVGRVAAAIGLAGPVLFDDLVAGVAPACGIAPPAELALIQFTSGSSGYSRGVRLQASALQANVTAMRRWLEWSPEQAGISWLPVHHDMGLIGALINIVVNGSDGWLMQPDDFLRSPLRYLTCVSDNEVAHAVMPNFGIAYLLRRIRPEQLAGLRFDSLRSMILGAERIDPHVLKSFQELLTPFGFDHRALRPAYGGAEATLAVTGLPVGESWIAAAAPSRNSGPGRSLEQSGDVILVGGPGPAGGCGGSGGEDGAGGEDANQGCCPDQPAGVEIIGCGHPLEGVEVTVIGEDGMPLPDSRIGEILVSGVSVAAGYLGEPGTASGTALADGMLHTGDAGFMKDGQLFVLGRLGDGLKVRGAMVFAESVEARIAERGVPERRAAILLGVRNGVPTAVVVLERPRPDWAAIAAEALRECLEEAELFCVTVPRGGLAVTSSGKPRRRVMWQRFCDGTLAGEAAPLPVR